MQCVQIAMWAWGYVYYTYTMVLAAIVLMGNVLSASLMHGQQKRLAAVANQTRLVPIVRKVKSCHVINFQHCPRYSCV